MKAKYNLQLQPRFIFLVDLAGAVLSAFLLGIVLVHWQFYFGMPKESLHLLACIPLCFVLYDIVCFFFIRQNFKWALLGIAVLNFLYCLLSIYFLFLHASSLSILAWVYFVVEIFIVALIAYWEWSQAIK